MGDAIIRLTLRKYRKLLKLIKRLPPEESQEALRQLRADMKSNISVSESEGELLRGALDDKIRYLKIMTPKQPGDADNLEEVAYYVVRDGKVVRGTAAKHSRVADGTISMSEAHSLHQKLLQRQHFGVKPPKYDPSTF